MVLLCSRLLNLSFSFRCILNFEALLQSITNRYKSLSSVQLQINFVDLQIELLEDLRLRLAQILRQVRLEGFGAVSANAAIRKYCFEWPYVIDS